MMNVLVNPIRFFANGETEYKKVVCLSKKYVQYMSEKAEKT
jgi:hypothetical protein